MKQALRYLSYADRQLLINRLLDFDFKHKGFLICLRKYFDIEVFRKSPLIWQDAWLYNYIMHDELIHLPKNRLITMYKKEAFIDNDVEFFQKKNLINSKIVNIDYIKT